MLVDEIRALEAQVARAIFGLTVEREPETIPQWRGWVVIHGDPAPPIPADLCSAVKQYACDPRESWALVARMRELGFDLKLHVFAYSKHQGKARACFERDGQAAKWIVDEPFVAIARAAVEAVEVTGDREQVMERREALRAMVEK